VLVFALQNVAEYRPGVTVRCILLAGLECHFQHRRTGFLTVELLDDVSLGRLSNLHFTLAGVSDMLGQDCPADPEGSQDGEEKARPAVRPGKAGVFSRR